MKRKEQRGYPYPYPYPYPPSPFPPGTHIDPHNGHLDIHFPGLYPGDPGHSLPYNPYGGHTLPGHWGHRK